MLFILDYCIFSLYSIDRNECLRNPCLNGATCVNTMGSYYCTCIDGWEGDLCDKGIVLVTSFEKLTAISDFRRPECKILCNNKQGCFHVVFLDDIFKIIPPDKFSSSIVLVHIKYNNAPKFFNICTHAVDEFNYDDI